MDDETDNTDPARFVFGALAANTNPQCFISPEQFQLDNTTVAPLQQLQVRVSLWRKVEHVFLICQCFLCEFMRLSTLSE